MTECCTQLIFPNMVKLPVAVDFSGGNLTSDAGVLFVRQFDEELRLTQRLSGCLVDRLERPLIVIAPA